MVQLLLQHSNIRMYLSQDQTPVHTHKYALTVFITLICYIQPIFIHVHVYYEGALSVAYINAVGRVSLSQTAPKGTGLNSIIT